MCTTSPSSRASIWKMTGASDAFKFELAGYLYGDLIAVGEAFGEGTGVGEGEGGDRVVGEHPLPDVAVSAGLVAFELVELDFDN